MDITRCAWCGEDPLYVRYHDTEWGVPVHDDRALFEALVLDGAQAGLSWITILRKREAYREAFDGFDPAAVDPSQLDLAATLSYTIGAGVALEAEARSTVWGENTLTGTRWGLALATSPAWRWRR